jgi:hypothetical protein
LIVHEGNCKVVLDEVFSSVLNVSDGR